MCILQIDLLLHHTTNIDSNPTHYPIHYSIHYLASRQVESVLQLDHSDGQLKYEVGDYVRQLHVADEEHHETLNSL